MAIEIKKFCSKELPRKKENNKFKNNSRKTIKNRSTSKSNRNKNQERKHVHARPQMTKELKVTKMRLIDLKSEDMV